MVGVVGRQVDGVEEVNQLIVENVVDEMVEKLVADELGVVSIVVLVEEEDVVLPGIEKIVIVSRPRLSCIMVPFNNFCMPSIARGIFTIDFSLFPDAGLNRVMKLLVFCLLTSDFWFP